MALIVEDGTNVANANGFATLTFVDGYHKDRGNEVWTGTRDERETAIIRASDFLNFHIGWRGTRRYDDQTMEWPRTGVQTDRGDLIDNDEIPTGLQRATAELAMVALTEDLAPNALGGRVRSRSEKSGNISSSVSFFSDDSPAFRKVMPLIRELARSQGAHPLQRT